jgi:hypothetical protein
MSDPDDGQLKQEIDKISHDIKRIMEKVEALYPKKKTENESDTALDGEDPGELKKTEKDKPSPE